jgi:hypothetical protein
MVYSACMEIKGSRNIELWLWVGGFAWLFFWPPLGVFFLLLAAIGWLVAGLRLFGLIGTRR